MQYNLSKIFERFHQVDASSTRKYQGVGIGLTLTKELVEKHGGELSVKSELGTGTCFTVQLPIKQAHRTDADSNITTEITEETEYSIVRKNEPHCEKEPIAQAFKSADRFFVFDSCRHWLLLIILFILFFGLLLISVDTQVDSPLIVGVFAT